MFAEESNPSVTINKLTYTLRDDGRSASVRAASTDLSGEVEILNEVTIEEKIYPVEEIEGGAFRNCNDITSVFIPNNIELVCIAFDNCTKLSALTIDNFDGGLALNNVGIPNLSITYLQKDVPDFVYKVLSETDRTARLRFVNREYSGSLTIPSEVTINDKQYSVTEIGYEAMSCCDYITSLTIPNSIISIGEYAFYCCYYLQSITIPNSVEYIHYYAFYGTDIKTINIDNFKGGLDFDDDYVPSSCTINYLQPMPDFVFGVLSEKDQTAYLKRVNPDFKGHVQVPAVATIKDKEYSVVEIGEYVLYDCPGITSITIPESVEYLDYSAFYNGYVTSITLPKTIKEVGDYAFYDLNNIKYIYIEDDETNVTWFDASDLPSDVEIFYQDNLPQDYDYYVAIPDGVTAKDAQGNTLATIGNRVYVNKSASITLVTNELLNPGDKYVASPSDNCTINGNVVSNITGNVILSLILSDVKFTIIENTSTVSVSAINEDIFGSVEIPATITIEGKEYQVVEIAEYGFAYCFDITSVTIPESVTNIGDYAFYDCYKLKTITIPKNVTNIGYEAFDYCTNLESVTFAEGSKLETIGDYAFEYCEKLKSIEIPNSVVYIGDYIFSGCNALNTVTIDNYSGGVHWDGEVPDDTEIVYLIKQEQAPSYEYSILSEEDQTAYLKRVNPEYEGIFNVPATVTINDKEYNVVAIGNYAFYNCYDIEIVNIAEGVKSIGEYAFYNCYDIIAISIPESVEYIGKYAFYYNAFKSINIPNGVTTIEESTFLCCVSLLSITIPESVETIGDEAFYDATGLSTIIIPKSVKSIGKSVFAYCSKLKTIYVENKKDDVDWEEDNLPSGAKVYYLDDIPAGAFSVTLPIDVTATADEGVILETQGNRVCVKSEATITLSSLDKKFEYIAEPSEACTINGNVISNITANVTISIKKPLWSFEIISKDDKTAKLSWVNSDKISGAVEIPPTTTIDGEVYKVIEIQEEAFMSCNMITSVTIPAGVSTIGYDAFYTANNISDVYYNADPENVDWDEADCDDFMGGDESYTTKLHVLPQYLDAWYDKFPGDVNVQFVIPGMALLSNNNNKTAIIDGDYTDEGTFSIPNDISIDNVQLDRTFTPEVYSTVILPFKVANPNEIGTFYTFNDVTYENGEWVADVIETDVVNANTPYLLKTKTANPDFGAGVEKLEAATEELTTENDKWVFTGTYEYIQWENGDNKVYGFAGEEVSSEDGDITIGEFVQAGAGAYINPFRCYLTFKGDKLGKRTPVMPQSIKVRVVDPKEEPSTEIVEPDSELVITPVAEISEQISAKAWSFNGTIYIESQPGTDYQIIDLSGRVIKIGVTHSTREEVTLNRNAGIVIVNINGKSFKVNL